jgi:hypothetical protein
MAGGMEVQLSLFRDPLCIQIRAADSIQDQYLPRYDADAGLSERLNRQWLSRQFSSVQLTDISDGKRLRKVRN